MLDLSVAMFDFQRVPPSTEPLSRYISSWGRLQRVPWRASTWSRICAQKKTTADFSENHKTYAAGLGV